MSTPSADAPRSGEGAHAARRPPIRVVLARDPTGVRGNVGELLRELPGVEVVGEVSSVGDSGWAGAQPEVVLVELGRSGERGAEIVQRLAGRFIGSAVLALSAIGDPDEVSSAFAAGARGFLLETASPAEIVDAVRHVAAGNRYLQPSLGVAIARAAEPTAPKDEEDE